MEQASRADFDREAKQWCFEQPRQSGDYTMAACSDGYELLYFVGYGENYRSILVSQSLRDDDYEAWKAEMVEHYTVQEHASNMKRTIAYANK